MLAALTLLRRNFCLIYKLYWNQLSLPSASSQHPDGEQVLDPLRLKATEQKKKEILQIMNYAHCKVIKTKDYEINNWSDWYVWYTMEYFFLPKTTEEFFRQDLETHLWIFRDIWNSKKSYILRLCYPLTKWHLVGGNFLKTWAIQYIWTRWHVQNKIQYTLKIYLLTMFSWNHKLCCAHQYDEILMIFFFNFLFNKLIWIIRIYLNTYCYEH